MVSIFTDIYSAVHGPKLQKKQFKLERARINAALENLSRARDTHIEETQRNRAVLGQMHAARRGFGKSGDPMDLGNQEKRRFDVLSKRKLDQIESAIHVATRQRQYIKERQKYLRKQKYAQALDNIVGAAMMGQTSGYFSAGPQEDASMGGGGAEMYSAQGMSPYESFA